MFKIVLFISLIVSNIFAAIDGQIDIVKRTNSIPKIVVSMASDSSSDFTLSKLKKSLEKSSSDEYFYRHSCCPPCWHW